MARSNTGSTSNWLGGAFAPVTALPLTISCWFNAANVTSTQSLVNIDTGGGDNYVSLGIDGNNEYSLADQVIIDPSGASTNAVGSGSTYIAGQWNHACITWTSTSASGRAAYLNSNGGAGGVGGITTPSGWDTTSVGGFRVGASTFGPMNGVIAEVGVWNVTLTAGEIRQLSQGVPVWRIRPESLQAYWLPRLEPGPSTAIDFNPWRKRRYDLTVNGSMPLAKHPTVIHPLYEPNRFSRWLQTGAAPAGRTTKNTRAFPLGMEIGMNWVGNI